MYLKFWSSCPQLHEIAQLIYNHKLETLYLSYGVNGQHGVVWDPRGQILIFTKIISSMLHSISMQLIHNH